MFLTSLINNYLKKNIINSMDMSGQDINMLACLIANALACDMSKQDLNTLRLLIGQIHYCLGTILAKDSNKISQNPTRNGKI